MAYNILIIDDSTTARAVISKTLEMSGVPVGKVYFAENGIKALEILKREWVDLAFTDINMPEMSGMELVQTMSEDEELREIPIVVVSTEGSQTRIDELRSHGIRAYIRKPFTPEELKQVVDDLMEGDN